MPAGFTRDFAERLNRLTLFSVREAEGGEVPLPSSVLLAPGGSNLELEDVTGEPRAHWPGVPNCPGEVRVVEGAVLPQTGSRPRRRMCHLTSMNPERRRTADVGSGTGWMEKTK